MHLGTSAPWSDRAPASDGLLYRAPSDGTDPPAVEVSWIEGQPGLRWRYADGTEFQVREDAREVWATWPAPLTLEDTALSLLGPVLGYVLRRLGVLALHASGVVIDGRAAAFSGWSGAGKSTIAAAIAAAGHAALADDVVALREVGGEMMAYPEHDRLRVWDDSARMLVGEGHSLPRLTPNWDKHAFPVEALGYDMARAPAPLGAIFLLERRAAVDDAPRVEPVRAADAFIPLVARTAANHLLDTAMRAEEFALLARVLARTPVYRLVPHADPAKLALLVSRVEETVGA